MGEYRGKITELIMKHVRWFHSLLQSNNMKDSVE